MSSREYCAELGHDPQLSRWLIGSVLLALSAGLWVVWQLPISAELRWLGGTGWALATGGRGWLTWKTQAHWRRLRIVAGGPVIVETRNGQQVDAAMTGNCVVLARLAWLDLVTTDGSRFCALVSGNARESEQWRRFQVIWRHMGSGP